MNSAFVSGKIRVDRATCQPLIEEYDKAVWNSKALMKGIYKEDLSYHPDAADAALYAYRYTYSYASTPASKEQFIKDDRERDMHEMNIRYAQERAERDELLFGNEWLYEN
jgi:hypothetical protein